MTDCTDHDGVRLSRQSRSGRRRDARTVTEQEPLDDVRVEGKSPRVSVWEIATKRLLGKLTIENGWSRTLSRLGFEALPISSRHAEHVEQLPWHHRDSFDRLLIAQALIERMTFVSADSRVESYVVDILG